LRQKVFTPTPIRGCALIIFAAACQC